MLLFVLIYDSVFYRPYTPPATASSQLILFDYVNSYLSLETTVDAIKDIKRKYYITRNWQGDPCVPSSLSWDGLQCSNDTIPRITSL